VDRARGRDSSLARSIPAAASSAASSTRRPSSIDHTSGAREAPVQRRQQVDALADEPEPLGDLERAPGAVDGA
jgi:hypothetical protein